MNRGLKDREMTSFELRQALDARIAPMNRGLKVAAVRREIVTYGRMQGLPR